MNRRWIVIVVAGVLIVALGGYGVFALISGGGAPPVALSSSGPSTEGGSSTGGSPDGGWTMAQGSFVGYRVREKLASLPAPSEAVGRTTAVRGSLTIQGTKITTATITADLTQLKSDEDIRDERIHSLGPQTDTFPEATFELTEPIVFDSSPPEGEEVQAEATGDLTLHGVTNQVTIPLQARWNGDTIEVVGSIPITFADYQIEPPNFGGFVTVEDSGTIELQLTFSPA